MCGDCGCTTKPASVADGGVASLPNERGTRSIRVMRNILEVNEERAALNRQAFDTAAVTVINLMSSPGSGKTRLLEQTAEKIGSDSMAVIEGDLETENDTRRLRAIGVEAHQITTGMACHLDAAMVMRGLLHLDLTGRRYLFIENVGNLVCPANFDLGQHANVILLSVVEGDDKPEKYPAIFRAADLVLITKTDLLPAVEEFDVSRAKTSIARIQPRAQMMELSAKTSRGIDHWLSWLDDFSQTVANRDA